MCWCFIPSDWFIWLKRWTSNDLLRTLASSAGGQTARRWISPVGDLEIKMFVWAVPTQHTLPPTCSFQIPFSYVGRKACSQHFTSVKSTEEMLVWLRFRTLFNDWLLCTDIFELHMKKLGWFCIPAHLCNFLFWTSLKLWDPQKQTLQHFYRFQ